MFSCIMFDNNGYFGIFPGYFGRRLFRYFGRYSGIFGYSGYFGKYFGYSGYFGKSSYREGKWRQDSPCTCILTLNVDKYCYWPFFLITTLS